MTVQELVSLLQEALPIMGKGVVWTLYLSVMAMLLGAVIGVCVAIIRVAQVPLLHLACRFYVSCMRGTPLLVQLFVLYYGLPSIGLQLERGFCTVSLAFFTYADSPALESAAVR